MIYDTENHHKNSYKYFTQKNDMNITQQFKGYPIIRKGYVLHKKATGKKIINPGLGLKLQSSACKSCA